MNKSLIKNKSLINNNINHIIRPFSTDTTDIANQLRVIFLDMNLYDKDKVDILTTANKIYRYLQKLENLPNNEKKTHTTPKMQSLNNMIAKKPRNILKLVTQSNGRIEEVNRNNFIYLLKSYIVSIFIDPLTKTLKIQNPEKRKDELLSKFSELDSEVNNKMLEMQGGNKVKSLKEKHKNELNKLKLKHNNQLLKLKNKQKKELKSLKKKCN